MKIGFEAKRAVENFTGLGNYSRFVVDILSKYYPDNEYFLFAPRKKKNPILSELMKKRTIHLTYPAHFIWRKLSSLWRIWGETSEIQDQEITLYHGLSNELPLCIDRCNITTVVTIHDLIFLHYPQYYSRIDRLIYNFKFKHACQHATRIIAVSECTKRDIISHYQITPEKIDVVYQGCDPRFSLRASKKECTAISVDYNLPRRFILYVGSIEERKNLLLAVRALTYIDPEVQLVAIGRRTDYTDIIVAEAAHLEVIDRLILIHHVPHQDLPALYQQASVFVYPSHYEGFGIPLLEALYSGVPVIATTGSCLEEAGGPHSIYVSPNNEEELAGAINRVLNDQELCKTMIEEGYKYTNHFNPARLAHDLMASYKRALQKE